MKTPLNTSIFIPSLNKTKVQAVQTLDESKTVTSRGLLSLCYLLLLRAQIGGLCNKKKLISLDKLPKLDTAKWAASAIAKNHYTYELVTLLAVGDSLQYIINTGEGEVTADKIMEKAIQKWEEIKAERPTPGSRILSPSLINENNLNSHIYGTVLQYIGKWQAISLYDQAALLKGISIQTVDTENLSLIFHNLIENLDVPIEENLSTLKNQVEFISNEFYPKELILLDNIDLGTKDNKLPLEKHFNVKRIAPNKTPNIKISEGEADNPLIKLLAQNLNPQKGNKKNSKKRPKAK